MRAHLRYLSYVLRHKWYVFVAGRRVGAPLWRLLIHDWSKFTPAEWFPYVRNFYGEDETTYTDRRRIWWILNGAISAVEFAKDDWRAEHERRQSAFDVAWLHHQKRNRHHWQYWVLMEDNPSGGPYRALPMPESYWREMVADWMGAGLAITGQWQAWSWYQQNRDNIVLHPSTRESVQTLLWALHCAGWA